MKIYLVTDGDYGVVGVFDSRDITEEWINKSYFRYSPTIEEHNLNSYDCMYSEPYRWSKDNERK